MPITKVVSVIILSFFYFSIFGQKSTVINSIIKKSDFFIDTVQIGLFHNVFLHILEEINKDCSIGVFINYKKNVSYTLCADSLYIENKNMRTVSNFFVVNKTDSNKIYVFVADRANGAYIRLWIRKINRAKVDFNKIRNDIKTTSTATDKLDQPIRFDRLKLSKKTLFFNIQKQGNIFFAAAM